jgi:hypothetical protein
MRSSKENLLLCRDVHRVEKFLLQGDTLEHKPKSLQKSEVLDSLTALALIICLKMRRSVGIKIRVISHRVDSSVWHGKEVSEHNCRLA